MSDLEQCPRCGLWILSAVHMLGPIAEWHGGRDYWPDVKWCTPDGIVILPFNESPEW